MAGLIQAAYRGERTVPLVVRLEHNHRVLRLTAAPLAGVEPGSVVILIEDVTEQRLLEAQIIQNDKMASIGQLVSGVAHELNNPLTSIAGLAELLLERPPHPELPREHLRVIHDQAERAGRIVRNLLTFARKGVPEKTAVDLNDVVARTSLLIMYELQLHGIELELGPESRAGGRAGRPLRAAAGPAQPGDQCGSGGEPVWSRASRGGSRSQPARRDGEAVLRVRDTGPGVPKHLAPYLFTPFFTTKAPGEGTGLGLSLSYGLVKAHGGALTYEPAPEGGAEFRVTLPLFESEAPSRPIRSRTWKWPLGRGPADPGGGRGPRRAPAAERAVHSGRPCGRSGALRGAGVEAGAGAGLRPDHRRHAGGRRTAEPFARALLEACPEVRSRLVVACSGEEELPARGRSTSAPAGEQAVQSSGPQDPWRSEILQ